MNGTPTNPLAHLDPKTNESEVVLIWVNKIPFQDRFEVISTLNFSKIVLNDCKQFRFGEYFSAIHFHRYPTLRVYFIEVSSFYFRLEKPHFMAHFISACLLICPTSTFSSFTSSVEVLFLMVAKGCLDLDY